MKTQLLILILVLFGSVLFHRVSFASNSQSSSSLVSVSFQSASRIQSDVLTWAELAKAREMILRQDVVLNDDRTFRAGEKFYFLEENSLGQINVVYQEVVAARCESPETHFDELTLIRPQQSGQALDHDPSVGVNLQPGCRLGIYLELVDYDSSSLFARP